MQIRTGIKQLVEFVLRTGSIDSRFTGTDRALLGAEIHRKLQKQQGKNYKAEQSLSLEISEDDIDYILYGRADGIIREENNVTIDEIKTVSTPLELVDENYSKAHWAQGCFYGYIICKAENLDTINIQLTYYNIDTEEVKRIVRTFSFAQLEKTVYDVLKSYRRWALLAVNWSEKRTDSLKNLAFPFENYRRGQRRLAVSVYNTIRNRHRLFACAPTGIGKTMSTVFPALKALGENLSDKLFYLTAKTVTAKAATDAVGILYNANPGLDLKVINITAKDKMCRLKKRKCDPVSCPYAKDYFDKVNDVVYESVLNNNVFSQNLILEIAENHKLCPYELSLDLSLWCDMIVCDYNYLFDPQAKLQRFFDNKKGEYTFLIDEAHNLPDRAREMYSAAINKKAFFEVKKSTDKKEKKLIKALNGVNNVFIEYRHKFDELNENALAMENCPYNIEKPLRNFVKACSEFFDNHKGEEVDENLLQLFFDTKFFIKIFELYNEKYTTLLFKNGDNVTLKLYCTDPSDNIDRALDTGNSMIAFSATLNPVNYYLEIIGGSGEKILVPSPFRQENLGLYVADNISTKYTDREKTLEKVCDMIYAFSTAKTGNYIVYFPSYSYMQQAYDLFCEKYDLHTIIQTSGMSEEEKSAFMAEFDKTHRQGLLGFCVMGGIYGEGIDLAGDKLIGTVIIGVGLPQINFTTDTLKDYYNAQGKNGFAYAYQYPGMNKVMQAAGRVIRTATDRGVVLLIDSRFTTPRYLENMPPHWNHLRRVNGTDELTRQLKAFWENQ